MRLNSGALFGRLPNWTCPQCTHASAWKEVRRGFSRNARPVRLVRPKRKTVYWAAAGGGIGSGLLFFGDDIKHGWQAAERSSRVLTTLAICINE